MIIQLQRLVFSPPEDDYAGSITAVVMVLVPNSLGEVRVEEGGDIEVYLPYDKNKSVAEIERVAFERVRAFLQSASEGLRNASKSD